MKKNNPSNLKILQRVVLLPLCASFLMACNSNSNSTTDTSDTDTSDTTDTTDTSGTTGIANAWLINTTGQVSSFIFDEDGDGEAAATGVQSVTSADGFTTVSATGIPAYETVITQEIYDSLTARPRVTTDFVSGAPIVNVGDTVKFGQDMGYRSSCPENLYWPPGPECPEDTSKVGVFPETPIDNDETTECSTGIGVIGYNVNGVSMYNWGDTNSYNNEGEWNVNATIAEQYDVDICGGHAANEDYHTHTYSKCLAETVGDGKDTHSPVYGFAADGYPVHGPWHAANTLAKSSWVARDFNDANDAYGCGGTGERNCVMVDEHDKSLGTEAAGSDGPLTSEAITTLSGNSVLAASGYYYEDHYFDSDLAALGGAYLDKHNGHDHDGIGYHYHYTIDNETDQVPAFPYLMGPTFKGEMQDGSLTSCAGDATGGGPPGGGPPGG